MKKKNTFYSNCKEMFQVVSNCIKCEKNVLKFE